MTGLFSEWNNRIAPVFDSGVNGLLIKTNGKKLISREKLKLPCSSFIGKVLFLKNIKVDELICGAISARIQYAIESHNIIIYPFVCGEINKIIELWMDNELENKTYSMPGCNSEKHSEYCRGRNRCRRMYGRN